MKRYFIEPRARKYLEGYGFLSFDENFSNNYKKNIGYRNRYLKNCFQKVVHKAAEATAKFKGNKIPDALAKLNDDKIVK